MPAEGDSSTGRLTSVREQFVPGEGHSFLERMLSRGGHLYQERAT